MKYLLAILCCISLAECPSVDYIKEINFSGESNKISWIDYYFMLVKGGSITIDEVGWQIDALYAPIDVESETVDYNEINLAKLNVEQVAKVDKDINYQCYYIAKEFKHIIFAAK